jgi:prophage antirepressor-like protein
MNELTKVFNDQNLIIVEENGEPHFLLRDVCNILEISNSRSVRQRLDEDVVSTYTLKTGGGIQNATFVNEDGLYDVILDSRKPEAKRFRKWITSEVLPSIRKTGGYQKPNNTKLLLETALEHEKKIETIESDVNMLKDTMRIDGSEEFRIKRNANRVVLKALGGKKSNAYKIMSRKVFSRFWNEFKHYFEIPRYGDLPKKEYEKSINFIRSWQPDTTTRLEIQELNNQQELEFEGNAS